MANPQIEALDTEISSLEKQISDNMNMNEINRIQERVISLKMQKQRLLSGDAMKAPADLKEQIQAVDDAIAKEELQVNEATNRLLGGSPQLQNRLTSLKLQKSRLLALAQYPSTLEVSQ